MATRIHIGVSIWSHLVLTVGQRDLQHQGNETKGSRRTGTEPTDKPILECWLMVAAHKERTDE